MTVTDRIERYIDRQPDGCWRWTGSLTTSGGYAQLNVKRDDGRWVPARVHRLTYEMAKGPIPEGLVLDHLCRTPACVNPDHLEAVTDAVNIRRGMAPAIVVARSGRCSRGHAMVGENVGIRVNGRRRCRECDRLHSREQVERRRAARLMGAGRVA